MTPERKEEIRQILSKERPPCKKCGYTDIHYRYYSSVYDHDYVRPVTIEDELLEALDVAEKELRSIYMIKKTNYMTVHDLVELLRWNIDQGNISPDAPVVEHMGRYYREVISVWVEGHGHAETIHLGAQAPDPQHRVLEHESQQEGNGNATIKD